MGRMSNLGFMHTTALAMMSLTTTSDLETDDHVLVRNVRVRGKHKLSDKWEQDISGRLSARLITTVYTVKPKNEDGLTRKLHRDCLPSCGFLPINEK